MGASRQSRFARAAVFWNLAVCCKLALFPYSVITVVVPIGVSYGATILISSVDNVTLFSNYFISICICNLKFCIATKQLYAPNNILNNIYRAVLGAAILQNCIFARLAPSWTATLIIEWLAVAVWDIGGRAASLLHLAVLHQTQIPFSESGYRVWLLILLLVERTFTDYNFEKLLLNTVWWTADRYGVPSIR